MPDDLRAEIETLKRLRDAASPLPWMLFGQPGKWYIGGPIPGTEGKITEWDGLQYAVAAVNLAPRLADEVDRLRAENERLKTMADRITSTLVKCLTCDGEGGWADDGEPSICDDCGGLGYTTRDAGGP